MDLSEEKPKSLTPDELLNEMRGYAFQQTDDAPPPFYHVLFYDDSSTPFDFVMDVLMDHFEHGEISSTSVALDVHEQGMGIAGTYPKDIADTKRRNIRRMCMDNGYGMQVELEKECSGS